MIKKFAVALLFLLTACGGGADPSAEPIIINKPTPIKGVDMPAGFQVFGDHGGIQVDETFVNFTLAHRGSFTNNGQQNDADADGGPGYSFSFPGDTPIVCFRSNIPVVVYKTSRSGGGVFTYEVKVKEHTGNFYSPATANPGNLIEWLVFDKMPNLETRAGINVYDANGRVTFNSDYPPMRIVALQKIPDMGNPTALGGIPDLTIPLTSGYYAGCITSQRMAAVAQDFPPQANNGYVYEVYGDALTMTPTAATASLGLTNGSGRMGNIIMYNNPPGEFYQRVGGYLMVVDISGL